MNPIHDQWHIDWQLILLWIAVSVFYYLVSDFKGHRSSWCYWVAIILLLLPACAPIAFMGSDFAFTSHMISHIILLLLCGPLLVLAIPAKPALRALKPILFLSAFFKHHSWLAWLTGAGIMWLWHIPAVFNATMGHGMLLNLGSLLLAGMIFSWPLFGPVNNDRISSLSGIFYLFTACISCSLLGLLITFSPPGTFGHYGETDKQVAGLVMWVPCCFVYLGGCLFLLMRWFGEKSAGLADEFIKLNNSLKDDNGN